MLLGVGAPIIGLQISWGLETLGQSNPHDIIWEWHLVSLLEVLVSFRIAPWLPICTPSLGRSWLGALHMMAHIFNLRFSSAVVNIPKLRVVLTSGFNTAAKFPLMSRTIAAFLLTSGLIAVLPPATSVMTFMTLPLISILHSLHVLLQLLDVGGLLPHEGHHLNKQVEIPLRVELHPECQGVTRDRDQRAMCCALCQSSAFDADSKAVWPSTCSGWWGCWLFAGLCATTWLSLC